MKRKGYKCSNCGEVTTYYKPEYPCSYCGYKEMLSKVIIRSYTTLTGREKDAVKTYIVNTVKDFRTKNIESIQRDFQLDNQEGLREIWQSVASYVIEMED